MGYTKTGNRACTVRVSSTRVDQVLYRDDVTSGNSTFESQALLRKVNPILMNMARYEVIYAVDCCMGRCGLIAHELGRECRCA